MSITYGMDDYGKNIYYPNISSIKADMPKWSITGRNYPPSMDSQIPGPNQYKSEAVKLTYKNSPQITMGVRHSELCSIGLPAHYQLYD